MVPSGYGEARQKKPHTQERHPARMGGIEGGTLQMVSHAPHQDDKDFHGLGLVTEPAELRPVVHPVDKRPIRGSYPVAISGAHHAQRIDALLGKDGTVLVDGVWHFLFPLVPM